MNILKFLDQNENRRKVFRIKLFVLGHIGHDVSGEGDYLSWM